MKNPKEIFLKLVCEINRRLLEVYGNSDNFDIKLKSTQNLEEAIAGFFEDHDTKLDSLSEKKVDRKCSEQVSLWDEIMERYKTNKNCEDYENLRSNFLNHMNQIDYELKPDLVLSCFPLTIEIVETIQIFIADRLSFKLYKKYIDLFDKIYRLVKLAIKRGIKVRFFEYNESFACGGEKGFLEPINSAEIASMPVLSQLGRGYSILQVFLMLSCQNKESLVFISPKKVLPQESYSVQIQI